MNAEVRRRLTLDRERQSALHYRTQFLKAHKDAAIALGKYCQAMGNVQSLTSELHQPGLGGQPEAENRLRELLISEPPLRTLLSNGYEAWKGWGWDKTTVIAPVTPRYAVAEKEA
jgi:hypothetical protein